MNKFLKNLLAEIGHDYTSPNARIYNNKQYFTGGLVTTPKRGLVQEPRNMAQGGRTGFYKGESVVKSHGAKVKELMEAGESSVSIAKKLGLKQQTVNGAMDAMDKGIAGDKFKLSKPRSEIIKLSVNKSGVNLANPKHLEEVIQFIDDNPTFNQQQGKEKFGRRKAELIDSELWGNPGKKWDDVKEKARREADKKWFKKYSNPSIEAKTRGTMDMHKHHAGGLREKVTTENTMPLEARKNYKEIRKFEDGINDIQKKQYQNNLNRSLSTSKKKLVFEALAKEEAALRAANPEFSKYKSSLIFKESSLSKTGFMKKEVMSNPELTISEGKTGQKIAYKSATEKETQEIIEMGKTSFKTYLQNSRNKTAAEAQAKLYKKLGIEISDICSNLVAGGGRIGFATKKCGMALVQSNPDEFIKTAGGEKYKSIYQKLLKESPNKVKSAARGIVKNIRKLGITNPFSWIGAEVWYVGLDTWASSAKGIPFGEALDKAFIFKDFGTTHSNLRKVAEEMGYSDLQLENLQQTLDLSANQQDIERREYNLPGFQKESEDWEKLKGTDLYTDLSGAQEKMASDQFKNAEKQLALANEKQTNLWSKYMSNISAQAGKDVSQITDEDINISFTSAYKAAEGQKRKELIAQGKEDYEDKARYVHPYSSGFGEAFYNIWPENWNIFNPKAGLLEHGSPEQVAEINKERNYLTWEQLQDPNVSLPKEAMLDLYGRSKDLGYLFEGASGGIAGLLKK